MYWSKKEESFIPCNLPKISTAKTKVAEPIKEYVMQSNLLLLKEYKTIIKPTDKMTYEDGTCFEKNARPKNKGNKNQYNFFWLFIANSKL